MKYLNKKTLLALGMSSVLGLAGTGVAQASALGSAVLEVDNFLIKRSDGSIWTNGVDLNVTAPQDINTGDVFADLDSVPGNVSTSGSSDLGEDLKFTQVCQGSGCGVNGIPDDSYAHLPAGDPAFHYALADADLVGSAINVPGVPGLDPTSGADAKTRADVSLTEADFGTANSNLTLVVSFEFIAAVEDTMTFEFDATPFVRAFIDDFGDTAFATISWNLELFGANGDEFQFNPSEINRTRNASDPNIIPPVYDPGSIFLTATTPFNLAPGVAYALNITHITQADATNAQQVPEPATLALLGVGLIGIGAARRTSKAKTLTTS